MANHRMEALALTEKFTKIGALCLVFVVCMASLSMADEPVRIYGPGIWACNQWTSGDQLKQDLMLSWADGFASMQGMAFALAGEHPPRFMESAHQDILLMKAALDDACKRAPGTPFYKAVMNYLSHAP